MDDAPRPAQPVPAAMDQRGARRSDQPAGHTLGGLLGHGAGVSLMPERMVIWWNVQRLLAPTGSRLSRALDATAAAGWTRAAYRTKLEHLGAVLREVGGGQ